MHTSHAGPTVVPGVNGPVVWGFFGNPFNDNNPNDQVVTPFAMAVGGTFSGKWDAPEGNGTTLAAQLANLRAGHAYINFHTVQFGGGEIRGNFPAENALRDSLVAGFGRCNGDTCKRPAKDCRITRNEFSRTPKGVRGDGVLRISSSRSGSVWVQFLVKQTDCFQRQLC